MCVCVCADGFSVLMIIIIFKWIYPHKQAKLSKELGCKSMIVVVVTVSPSFTALHAYHHRHHCVLLALSLNFIHPPTFYLAHGAGVVKKAYKKFDLC